MLTPTRYSARRVTQLDEDEREPARRWWRSACRDDQSREMLIPARCSARRGAQPVEPVEDEGEPARRWRRGGQQISSKVRGCDYQVEFGPGRCVRTESDLSGLGLSLIFCAEPACVPCTFVYVDRGKIPDILI
ncbi:hypothetical protein Dimus_032815 [Dionaea muscipula]